MTVALVDDEYWIRQGLKARISWDQLGLTFGGEAANGADALALFDERAPDLVLIDIKMPAPDGLEVVRQASETHPGIAFVVITGFGEFEYAQKALRYGVRDFLLKPVDPVQLNETLARLRADREARGSRLAAFVTARSALPPTLPAADPEDLFQVAVLRPGLAAGGSAGRDPEAWLRARFTGLPGPGRFSLWAEGSGWTALFRLGPGVGPMLTEGLGDLCRDFRAACDQDLSVGLGRPGPLAGAPRSWGQARSALGNRLLHGPGRAFLAGDPTADGLADSLVLFNRHTERKLIRLAEDREAEAFFLLLETVFQGLEQARTRLDFRTLEVILWRLYTVLVEGAPTTPPGTDRSPGYFLARIETADTLADLEAWFTEAFRASWTLPEGPRHRPDAMEAARDYVEHNYFSDLTLSEMARRFGLHPNYFSQKFKETVGTGLVDYVRTLRLTRAHELLKHPQCSVEEAAHGVGYDDPKYFSDLFKAHFGVTPTQFRDANQE